MVTKSSARSKKTAQKSNNTSAEYAVKTSRGKKDTEDMDLTNESDTKKPTESRSGIRVKKTYIRIFGVIAGIILVGALLYTFRSLLVAATVNGQPISRLEVIKELEKQGGKQTMNSIVTKTLILQEARKKNITVSDQEIQDELKKIEKQFSTQGRNLDDLLAAQGMSKTQLTEQIRIQKLIEKILGKDIQVTDKEVQDYIDKNKDALPPNAKPEELKTQVKEQIKQQKLSNKFQTWIADVQKNAKINYIIKY